MIGRPLARPAADQADQAEDDAFRGFVVARWSALVRTAYLMTGDHGRAEDLVQTTLERMHKHWRRIERRDAPEVYARRVMINEIVASGRRQRFREVPLGHAPEPAAPAWSARGIGSGPPRDQVADPVVDRDAMWQALSTLPARMRAVVVLRFYEDLTEADTAALLDCSVGTVKSQTSRGLDRLRAALSDPPDPGQARHRPRSERRTTSPEPVALTTQEDR